MLWAPLKNFLSKSVQPVCSRLVGNVRAALVHAKNGGATEMEVRTGGRERRLILKKYIIAEKLKLLENLKETHRLKFAITTTLVRRGNKISFLNLLSLN